MHQGHSARLIQLVQRVLAGSLVGAFIVAPNFGRPVLQVRGEDGLRAMDRKNGVNPVALLGVVLRLHTTAGSSWSHFQPDLFSRSKILGLRPCRIMPLARST
jgi:hypothetical protein